MSLFKRLFGRKQDAPQPQPELPPTTQPEPTAHRDVSPMELYTRFGAVPTGRAADILMEAERSWRRPVREYHQEVDEPRRPSTVADDEAVLRMLAGAHFGPNAKVTLPTGREIDAAEAQALTSFYAPAVDEDGES